MSENEKISGMEPEKKTKEKKVKAAEKKPGFFARLSKWFRELRSDLKKVQWPSKKQTVNNTVVVIVCVVVAAIFLGIFDALATAIIDALLHLAGKG